MDLHLLYSFPIAGTPEVAITILELADKAALLLVENSRRAWTESNQEISPFLSFLLLTKRAFLLLGDRPVEPLSTRSQPISRVWLISVDTHTHTHSLSLSLSRPFLSCSWTTLPPSQHPS
jgi:hypothetical protein